MIYDIIKRVRREQGLSQLALAGLANVPRSQIQILEKGGNVTRETLDKIVTALDLALVVISREDIQKMRNALADLDGLLSRLTSQIPPAPTREERFLEMSRDLQDIVRAAANDPAMKARLIAYGKEEAARTPDPDEE